MEYTFCAWRVLMRKGNGSALVPYEVTFVVMNETTLTVSDPYPNPSNSDVYFKIVVSGNSPPDQLELRIIAPNGQLHDTYRGRFSCFAGWQQRIEMELE
ncbi:MAG: hypothetical protein QM762_22700 [Chryseolinea sp.]